MDISNILSKEILQVNKLIVEKLASDIELIGDAWKTFDTSRW